MHVMSNEQEILYDGRVMITETDPQGRITFANRKFVEMTGYQKIELIGNSHNVVRHPDMPQTCFYDMWITLKNRQSWQGYVKNLRKDGAFYWVIVHIHPKVEADTLLGFIAARKKPDRVVIDQADAAYKQARNLERQGAHESALQLIRAFRHTNVGRFPHDHAI